jgi:hypothetical protein
MERETGIEPATSSLGISFYTLQTNDLRDSTPYSPVYPRKKVQLTQPIRNRDHIGSQYLAFDFLDNSYFSSHLKSFNDSSEGTITFIVKAFQN